MAYFSRTSIFVLISLLCQLVQISAFYNGFRISSRCQSQALYANPLFFGGKRLPVKEEKIKEVKVDTEDNEDVDEDDVSQLVKIHDEERLQKVIARAGLASRREAEKMILDGRVVVNGKLTSEPGVKVKPRKDIILVDGKKVILPDSKSTFWVVVNKPRAVLTTMADDKDRDTLLSIVPKAKELRLLPVGRLDRDTTGLMILTNENGWIHPLTHPSFRHVKRYEVVVQGMPSEDMVNEVCAGIQLPGETIRLQPCKMSVIDADRASGLTLIDITLDESKPQQIQLLMEYLQCPVVSMKRVEFGPLKLGSLRRGQWREMTAAEITKLKLSCEPAKTEKPERTGRRNNAGGGGRGGYSFRGDSRTGRGEGRGGRGATRVFGAGLRRAGPSTSAKRPGSGYASRTGTAAEGGQGAGLGEQLRGPTRSYGQSAGRGRGGDREGDRAAPGRGGDNRGRVWTQRPEE